ncbi:CvfB family protein [Pseudofulvibacter geojedonensis]|uniref:S1 RNA-binding domain-containing protein n=1 Tax=Pseudofulvibacter geojedonensis TaxID=1123758 RepID=A0ABW3I2V9_9FLAO
MQLGKINSLTIDRNTSPGLFLIDEEDNDVLLPGKYIPKTFEIGDKLDVFVYLDNEERIIATTLKPYIELNDFAWLRVNQITRHGAFLDMGIEKDLFVPFKEQARPMQEGKSYLIYMHLDEKTDRLVGTSKINKFLSNDELTVSVFDEVDLIVSHMTDIGVNVIINKKHKGLVYEDQVFKDIRVGDKLKGIIKKIRKDNKIDVSLQQIGYKSIEPNAQRILTELEDNEGFLGLTDKSNPEIIKQILQMSKKNFKKAIGSLYKQRLITIEKDGIYTTRK